MAKLVLAHSLCPRCSSGWAPNLGGGGGRFNQFQVSFYQFLPVPGPSKTARKNAISRLPGAPQNVHHVFPCPPFSSGCHLGRWPQVRWSGRGLPGAAGGALRDLGPGLAGPRSERVGSRWDLREIDEDRPRPSEKSLVIVMA